MNELKAIRINFYLNPNKAGKATKSILAYIRHKGKVSVIATPYKCEPTAWNAKKQMYKTQISNSMELNNLLQVYRSRLEQLAISYIRDGITSPIKDYIVSNLKNRNSRAVENVLNNYIETQASKLEVKTVKVIKSFANQLRNYADLVKIELHNIDTHFINGFRNYLTNQNLNNSTTKLYLSKLNSFLIWTQSNGFIKELPKSSNSTLKTNYKIIALSSVELEKFENFDPKNEVQRYAKAIFLLECYTGQRYIDIVNMDYTAVSNNTWHVSTLKTNDNITIPLTPKALEQIEVLKSLTKFTYVHYNETLKFLGKLIGLNDFVEIIKFVGNVRSVDKVPMYELLTSHVARKTFVTQSLTRGMNLQVVMKITGHKNYTTMQRYLNISSEKDFVRNEVLKVWQ